MGAMLFGGVESERIQFNEDSLWSGDNNWDGDYDCGDHGFGSYRNFGDLYVEFGGAAVAGLARRITAARWTSRPGSTARRSPADGVAFTREAFASRPDQVMVFRYTASKRRRRPFPGGCVLFPASPAQDGRRCQGTLLGRRDAQRAQARLRVRVLP